MARKKPTKKQGTKKKEIKNKTNRNKITKIKINEKIFKKNKVAKKQKNKPLFSAYFWLIIAAIIVMTSLLIFNLWVKYELNHAKINEHYEYDIDVIVAENAGFNLDKDKIHFGKVPITGRSSREIIMTVPVLPAKITLSIEGNISEFVKIYPDNEIILIKNNEQAIELEVYIPMETQLGKYEGKLIVDIMN